MKDEYERSKAKAEREGKKKYMGKMHKCGTAMYYVKSDNCVHCHLVQSKARRIESRSRIKPDIETALVSHKANPMYQPWGLS